MNEKASRDELKAEIERGHFAKAAFLAVSLGLHEKEIHDFRLKALWQMSAVYRNAPGTKSLAKRFGFSKKELEKIMEQYAEEKRKEGDDRPLKPCYDHSTGKHLSFEEWMAYFFKNWENLIVS